MSRARELARLGNANAISVDTSNNVGLGTSVSINYKLDVVGDANFTGVLTATSFGGDGSSLTGVAATDYVVSNSLKVLGVSTFVGNTQLTATTASTSSATGALVVSGGVGIAGSLHVGENVSVGGTLTYEDVTNIDVIGIITARAGVLVNGGRGIDIAAGGLEVTGVTTIGTGLSLTDDIKARFGASGDLSIYHDGSNSYIEEDGTGQIIIRGWAPQIQAGYSPSSGRSTGETAIKAITDGAVELYYDGVRKLNTLSNGVAVVGLLSATTLSGNGSALTNLPAAGISTSASTSAGIVSTLALSSAQDHKVTVSGVSTFTCSGGSEGDSHTLRITNSGITTVGFSTYFLFPSGSAPSVPTADGTVSLISFTVHRVGTPGIATQLLAGASLNFS